MDRAAFRRRTPAQWMKYRDRPPTVARLLDDAGLRLLPPRAVMAAVVVAMAMARLADPLWAGIAIGLLLGAIVGNLQRLDAAVRAGPVTSAFLDGARIERAARDEGVP